MVFLYPPDSALLPTYLDSVRVKWVEPELMFQLAERNSIALPPGIQLKQVDPQALEVTLDLPVVKTLPLQADWTGKLADGLILEDVRMVPDTDKVIGGSQMLKDIQTIYTEKIPLEGITTGGTATVSFVLQPSSLKLEDGAGNRVDVIYKVKRRPAAAS